MSIPDPVTTGVVTATALQLAKQAQDFIATASGHPGESLGEIFGDWSRRRMQNVMPVANKAHLILLNLGVEPKPVPLKVIQPLLEAASLEEEPELREIWSNLLANAADPREERPVSPTFSGMLKDLSARDVKFLDALYKQGLKSAPGQSFATTEVTFSANGLPMMYADAGLARRKNLGRASVKDWNDYPEEYAADMRDFRFTLEMALRHGILKEKSTPVPVESRVITDSIDTRGGISPIPIKVKVEYSFTHLGACFVAACQNPKKTD
jgi:hypothetical protein